MSKISMVVGTIVRKDIATEVKVEVLDTYNNTVLQAEEALQGDHMVMVPRKAMDY